MSYFLPLELVVTNPSTQAVREEVGEAPREVLGVAPVVADADPEGGGLPEASVTNMTEIKFEPPGLALCPSLFK
jgi:hypothetical protein